MRRCGNSRTLPELSGSAIGDLDVGSVWVLPPTVTLQYHFMPHTRFSPFVGAVKQIFLNTTAHIDSVLGPVKARVALNPLVVGAGIGYRF